MAQITTYDVLENVRDVSPVFNLINQPTTVLLNILGVSSRRARDKRHYWWDDQRLSQTTTLGGAYTASDSSVTVASTDGMAVNTILTINSTVLRVTAVTNATTAAVTAIAQDANQSNGATVRILRSQVEGKAYEDREYKEKVERLNVCQIIDEFFKITGSQQATAREVGGDLYQEEELRKIELCRLSLGRAIWQAGFLNPSDNATPRIMGGIDYWLLNHGYAPSAQSFSADNFDAFLLELSAERGGNPTHIGMNPADMSDFSSLDASKLQKDYDDEIIGRKVTAYASKHGHVVSLVTDVNAAPGYFRAFNPMDAEVIPFRPFGSTVLAQDGDNVRGMIVGEYTLELRNVSTHGIFTKS